MALPESVTAPVEPGQPAGALEYWLGGTKLGEVPVLINGNVREAGYLDYLKKMAGIWSRFSNRRKEEQQETEESQQGTEEQQEA